MRVLPLWCLGIRPASLMFAAGEKYMNYRYFLRFPVDKNTELLQIHALDYDIYLKEKDGPCSEKSIAVFIDVYYPFHPDYGIFKTESPVSADNYYRLLNNFFDLVEEKTGLEVIIAAHPRSDYENHPDYFKGRKCVKGKTVDLIKECRLVLAHFSVALHLANLFYKPVTFMTFSDLYKTHEGDSLAEYAKSFNKKPVFIDKDMNIDWEQELMVSKEHYDDYRRSYIKVEGSEGLPFWQIVANKLRDKF